MSDFLKRLNIKENIAPALTILTIIALFGIIFLEVGWVERTSRFYTELCLVSMLAIQTRFYWYESTQETVLNSEEIVNAKDSYDTRIENLKIDVNELDSCLDEMDEENYQNSIKKDMGHYTPQNIGEKKYYKMLKKAQKKAEKIRKLKSTEIITRSESVVLYDSKDYTTKNKMTYQALSAILSVALAVLISAVAFEELILSWKSVFRYILYLWSIFVTLFMTKLYAKKQTRNDVITHLARLHFILDKFELWRHKKRGEPNVRG